MKCLLSFMNEGYLSYNLLNQIQIVILPLSIFCNLKWPLLQNENRKTIFVFWPFNCHFLTNPEPRLGVLNQYPIQYYPFNLFIFRIIGLTCKVGLDLYNFPLHFHHILIPHWLDQQISNWFMSDDEPSFPKVLLSTSNSCVKHLETLPLAELMGG